jgi:hypothetical protein
VPALGLAAISAVLLAPGAGAAKGGPIRIYVQGTTVTTPIMVTGAVTDYGTATSVTKTGKPNQNGNYERIVLKKGSFWVNAVALNRKLANAKGTFSKTQCYFEFSGSGPTTLFKGTGAYAGIGGNLTVTVTFAGIAPRLPNGKCNPSQNAKPLAQYETVMGSGTATF